MSRIINRVIDNSNGTSDTLLDLTEDTVNADNLLLNETAHNREGEPIRGTHISGGAVNSVNGKTGTVILDGTDIILASALPIGGQNRAEVEEAISALNNAKVDKVTGKGLSTEDFTTSEKTKLDNLANIKLVGSGLSLNSSTGELTATGGSGGGHTILNESGTEMPQRSKLQFEGCEVTDDSTNDITKIKAEGGEVISYADYQQLTPQQQANGDYFIPDYPDTPTGFDETPTVGSTNPVTSNGIATELNAIKTFIGVELESAMKLVGDTSVTFTDSVIKTTSGINLKSENASDTPIFRNPAITRSNGSVTFTFPPLTENTKFYLEVRNYEA